MNFKVRFLTPSFDGARRVGFTLLEILLVMALISVLLAGLGATIRLFFNNYSLNERRVGRAQLARSISQMLSDDLGAAVQDPIQAVADDPNRQFIRHFGLRGDARSLQIDVVQPNPFAQSASVEENKRVQSGREKSIDSKQAPELKTIFYEFVPINALESTPDEEKSTSKTSDSKLSGTLSSSNALDAAYDDDDASESFWNGFSPLARKHGLSRRELDYETPEEEEDDGKKKSSNETSTSNLSGSLTSIPSSGDYDSLDSSSYSVSATAFGGSNTANQKTILEPLTAAQIALDSDDGIMWAPEVLDCRFSYFDGEIWLDAWDSLERKGLPVAIRVELKLAPLDDVDLYRQSPYLLQLPQPPSLDTIAELQKEVNGAESSDEEGASRLAGSLSAIPDRASSKGTPVDVFNSYRTLKTIRLALQGTPRDQSSLSPFKETKQSAALEGAGADAGIAEEDEGSALSLGMGGGLSSSVEPTSDLDFDASSIMGTSEDKTLHTIQALTTSGVVLNEMGICVDYGNFGSYITIEGMANEIGIAEPSVYEVITYLPTTPLSRAKSLARRRSGTVQAGNVSTRERGANASSSRGRGRGANPYASGTARRPRERSATERTVANRTANSRSASNRTANQRSSSSRTAGERSANSRAAAERSAVNRNASGRALAERSVGDRQLYDRSTSVGLEESLPIPSEAATTTSVGDLGASLSTDAVGTLSAPVISGVEMSGGLGALNDPFEIVNSTFDEVPFATAGSSFDSADAALGEVAPGLIESSTGMETTVAPTSTPSASKQQQTWIRGKK